VFSPKEIPTTSPFDVAFTSNSTEHPYIAQERERCQAQVIRLLFCVSKSKKYLKIVNVEDK